MQEIKKKQEIGKSRKSEKVGNQISSQTKKVGNQKRKTSKKSWKSEI